jgi:hypothetical protein
LWSTGPAERAAEIGFQPASAECNDTDVASALFRGLAMDVTTISSELLAWLAPFLPHLVRLGERTAEEAGRRLGEEAWEHAKLLWDRLRGSLEQRPAAMEAVRDAAAAPDDDDATGALRLQLRKLLASDETLAEEVRRLLAERPGATGPSLTVTASGDRAIAVGHDVISSRLDTGDNAPRPQ